MRPAIAPAFRSTRQIAPPRLHAPRWLTTTWLLAALCATAAVTPARAETDQEYCDRQEGPAKVVCLRNLAKTGSAAPTPAAAAPAAAKPSTAATPAASGAKTAVAASGDKPYQVTDGYHVDAKTMDGFRTWRAAACDRCHGPDQEGMVGPSLIESLKTLSEADFKTTVTKGRLEKGMPSFESNPTVVTHLDGLYAYLKGRSDGAITKSKVEPQ